MTAIVERVVVVLDAVSEHRAALDTAARLAARWRVRLHGVFVEDAELLRLATLPFARQVSLHAGVETLTVAQVERQLRAFAETARRDLMAAARHHQIDASFAVVRGPSTSEAVAASPGDFLVTCTLTRPIGGHFRLEWRAWSAAEPAPASVLLAHRQWETAGAVVILLRNRDAGSVRLIEAAAAIAEAAGAGLTVVCSPELARGDGFETWLGGQAGGHAVPVSIEPMPAATAALIRRIVELDCRIVAIEAGAEPHRLRDIVARIACDVLVVR